MAYKLNVGERLNVLGILPKEGNFVTIGVVKGIIDKLALKDTEMEQYEVKTFGGEVRWNEKGAERKDVDLSSIEVDIIKKSLRELDERGKITIDTHGVFEIFCVG